MVGRVAHVIYFGGVLGKKRPVADERRQRGAHLSRVSLSDLRMGISKEIWNAASLPYSDLQHLSSVF